VSWRGRRARVARRAPKPGQRGSRRWRRHRLSVRRAEARHRRRVHQAHHEAAKRAIAFAGRQQVGTLLVGDPSTSPATRWAECRTCAYGNGDAPTLRRPYETRPNAPASSFGWWTSAVPPPPVRPAGNAFQSQGAVASPVRTASSRATAILQGPTTSPPSMAADPRGRVYLCSSSTAGPASCRHGVTDAATCTTGGGGPAWPRGLSGEHPCSPERRSHDARLHLGSSEDQATSPSRATVP
jgi:hypothetical protein